MYKAVSENYKILWSDPLLLKNIGRKWSKIISGVQNQRVVALELHPMPLRSIFENFLEFLETGLYIIMDIEKAMSLIEFTNFHFKNLKFYESSQKKLKKANADCLQ